MVLFTTLLITLMITAIILLCTVGFGGAVLVVVFGDAILCVLLIALIIRHFIKKRKNK